MIHRFEGRFRALVSAIRRPGASGHGLHYLPKWLLLGILIGIVAAIGALVFQKAIQLVTGFALGDLVGYLPPQPLGEGTAIVVQPLRRWLIPVVVALGGLISGLIVFKLAPEAEGHGTDAAIEAFHHKEGKIRWRIPYVKLGVCPSNSFV